MAGAEEELFYSVSPIYGNPGIWVLDPTSGVPKRVVDPMHRKEGWPEGADMFELVGIKGGRLLYWYTPDISWDGSFPKRGKKEVRSYDIAP